MSKIRMDFARNEVNAGTLRIIDKVFFDTQSHNKAQTHEEVKEDQPNFGQISANLVNGIQKMLDAKPVTAEELGFGFGPSSDEDEQE